MFARCLDAHVAALRVARRFMSTAPPPPMTKWGSLRSLQSPSGLSLLPKTSSNQARREPALEASTSTSTSTSAPPRPSASSHTPARRPTPDEHLQHRLTLKKSFPAGWRPPRTLSREAMDGLRALHAHDPRTFSTPALADKFRVSPEAVRRILRSRWVPSAEERAGMLERERRRKMEYIGRRVEREREERWARREAMRRQDKEEAARLKAEDVGVRPRDRVQVGGGG